MKYGKFLTFLTGYVLNKDARESRLYMLYPLKLCYNVSVKPKQAKNHTKICKHLIILMSLQMPS